MQIRRRQTQVDSVPGQNFTHIAAINDRQRVEAEDAGNQSFGFDVGQTAGAQREFVVAVPFRDANAGAFHLTHGKAKAFAYAS